MEPTVLGRVANIVPTGATISCIVAKHCRSCIDLAEARVPGRDRPIRFERVSG
eukprot:SAG31_NODE_30358_length_382_cov_0.901060_1_plen_52_part_10